MAPALPVGEVYLALAVCAPRDAASVAGPLLTSEAVIAETPKAMTG
jgi:hypothetical protein